MGRITAAAVHLTACLVGGVLYVLFVLPRWWELMGDVSHTFGTVLRIAVGVVLALAALPALLILARSRGTEVSTPGPSRQLRQWSMIAHLAAGALIVATAISEIWVSLNTGGPWLFGVYGAAAALAILGAVAFYLAFVAEQPAKPPRVKKPRRKRGKQADADEADETEEATIPDETDELISADDTATPENDTAEDEEPAEVTAESPAEPVETATEKPADTVAAPAEEELEPAGALRNKRPTGKASHRLRRRNRGGVALDD